jgi:hypothetical protein
VAYSGLPAISVVLVGLFGSAGLSALTDEDIHMLQDAGGWEYVKISNASNGFPTKHHCFDGNPHPDCNGTLVLQPEKTFVKKIYINGLADTRKGKYSFAGNQITFVDELALQDGPYQITLNREAKTLVLEFAGQRIDLELESQYRDKLKKKKAKDQR